MFEIKKHQIFIDNYYNLYIYRLDAQKLKEKYKPSVSFVAVDIDDTASNESYSEANIDDTASNESYSEANIDDTASNESYSEANIDDTASNESYSEANIDDTASNESYSEANIDDTASNESYSEANIDTRKTGNMNTKSITTEMQQLIVWHLCYGEITKIYCLHN